MSGAPGRRSLIRSMQLPGPLGWSPVKQSITPGAGRLSGGLDAQGLTTTSTETIMRTYLQHHQRVAEMGINNFTGDNYLVCRQFSGYQRNMTGRL